MAGSSPVSRDIRRQANATRVRSYARKRYVAGAWVVVLAFVAANHYLNWGLLGSHSRPVFAATMLAVLVWMSKWGPSIREMRVHKRLKRFREDAAWREVVGKAEQQSRGDST
jgi:hypothetical protein